MCINILWHDCKQADKKEEPVVQAQQEGELEGARQTGKSANQTFKILLCADNSDTYTKNVLKKIWNASSTMKRQVVLRKAGFSEKYAESSFENLSPAIQSKIVTLRHDYVWNVELEAYPAWTEPQGFPKKDWKDLKNFYDLYSEGDFMKAAQFGAKLDTVIREMIPDKIYKAMGCKNPPFFD